MFIAATTNQPGEFLPGGILCFAHSVSRNPVTGFLVNSPRGLQRPGLGPKSRCRGQQHARLRLYSRVLWHNALPQLGNSGSLRRAYLAGPTTREIVTLASHATLISIFHLCDSTRGPRIRTRCGRSRASHGTPRLGHGALGGAVDRVPRGAATRRRRLPFPQNARLDGPAEEICRARQRRQSFYFVCEWNACRRRPREQRLESLEI